MDLINWEERPFVPVEQMSEYRARDPDTARKYGQVVRSAAIANVDYKIRYAKLNGTQSMQPPPSCGRIFLGNIVVRNLGTPNQYETWMPDHVFEELYEAVG